MVGVDLWVCCRCGGANLMPLTGEHCPVCGHDMCSTCLDEGGPYDSGYATTGRECDAEREVYNDASVSPDHSE